MAVVLGYDESPGAEVALDTAIRVAARWEEPLTIVYGAGPPGGVGEEHRAHRDALMEIGQHALDRAVELAREQGVPTEIRLVDAKPAQALLARRRRAGRDGHRGRHHRREPAPERDARLDAAQAPPPQHATGALRPGRADPSDGPSTPTS